MLTHANLTAACAQYTEVTTRSVGPACATARSASSCVLPLFHIYALSVVMMLGFRLGAELVLASALRSRRRRSRTSSSKKITVYPGVPTMHVAMLSLPGVETMDFSSLRFCSSGGAPLPVAVQHEFERVTGCRLDRRLGHDRDLADRHVHPAARAGGGRLLRRSAIPGRR